MQPNISRLVSRYGVRPSRRDGSDHFHAGTDISTGQRNSPIFAVQDGTVELVSSEMDPRGMTGYGNAVVINHDNKFTLYAHMSSVLVSPGQRVVAGQQLGTMGNTTNGQFSPLPGQSREAWEASARARGYRSGPMVPHLHLEVRRPREDGSSPFPGPYPRSADAALYNLDPQEWMRSKGMVFTRRGGIELTPGGAAERSRGQWEPQMAAALARRGVSGLGQVKSVAPVSAASFGPAVYEPVSFERDVRFGLTPVEWGVLGVVSSVAVAAVVVTARRRRAA
jgi:hypothetical protein